MSRTITLLALVLAVCQVEAYNMVSRWGAASMYIPSPPSILISGGKTPSPDGGTYSSSPNSPDVIRLSLLSNFSTSSAPYELLNTTSSPAYAWHTLSLTSYNTSALSFGGDGGPSTALPAGTDSSWLLSIPDGAPPGFAQQSSSWANQPQRRILHSAATGPDGMVYITGGQRNDGSGLILSDAYALNANTSTFTPLPNLPRGTAHHLSAFLPNGTLIVFGGIYTSTITGNPTLSETSTIYSLDTKAATPAWWETPAGGSAPPSRRGASGVMMTEDKMYVLGGTGMQSAEAMGDMWIMDLKAGAWSQVSTTGSGPSARFDHTALNIGQGQMLVVGGYGAGAPSGPETYIFDTASNAWTTSYAALAAPSFTSSAAPSETLSVASAASASSSATSEPSQSASISSSQSATSSDSSAPPSSSSPSGNTQPSEAQLTKSAQIGLALGVTMGLGILAALIVLTIRRRRAGKGSPDSDDYDGRGGPLGWLSPRPPPVEKDGRALLLDPRSGAAPGEWSEKGGIVGLGLGAVGAGLSALRLGTKQHAYNQLEDDGPGSGPARQPIRRAGAGIKLIGPRSNPSTSRPGPKSPPRVDILHDEDSRTFLRLPAREGSGATDWKVDRKGKDEWRSAASVLGHGEPTDPFEDAPLIRGGPVPTPIGPRSERDPFDDGYGDGYDEVDITTAVSRGPGLYQLPPLSSSDPLDIAGLLVPRRSGSGSGSGRHGDSSLPRSAHSRGSTNFSASDAEEGIVHHAQFASQASASYSPQEAEYVPIKRNESFFRRMASGGISSLMSISGVGAGRRQSVRRSDSRDIRDPTPGPGPALWPVESRDELTESGSADLPHPPSTWRGIGAGRGHGHESGPSMSSLASARSMRDMVIVQREGTDSSEASLVVLEQDHEEGDYSVMGTPVLDGMSPVGFRGEESFADRLDRSFFASPTEEDFALIRPIGVGVGVPTSCSPAPKVTKSATPANGPATAPVMTNSHTSPPITSPTASGSGDRSAVPLPPSGSPLPKYLVEHRRPVKDMVFSINKRASTRTAGGLTVEPMSPTSQYSVTPGQTPFLGAGGGAAGDGGGPGQGQGHGGKGMSWQVRRRESLVVANPDKRGLRGGA